MTKYYMLFDAKGVLVSRLSDDRFEIPENAIEVEYDFWVQTIQENDGQWKLNADGTITKYPFPPPPPPTPEEILATNKVLQASLIAQASQAMAPILVSLQLGDATDEETVNARAWQAYYRELKLVDVSVPAPEWPITPE
jgi:hypothetical protein